jgi:hypothetical protein
MIKLIALNKYPKTAIDKTAYLSNLSFYCFPYFRFEESLKKVRRFYPGSVSTIETKIAALLPVFSPTISKGGNIKTEQPLH